MPPPQLFLWGLCILVAASFLFPLPARADGGAPNLAYVAGTAKGISVIDVGQQRAAGEIAIQGDPHTILLSPDGRFLYVTQPLLDRVVTLETATKKVSCMATVPGHPTLLALGTNGNVLYAAGNGAPSVSMIDPSSCKVKQQIQMVEMVYGIAIAQHGSDSRNDQLWVATAHTLRIFDVAGKLLDNVAIVGAPEYLCIPQGSAAYVTTRQGSVLAVNLDTHKVIGTLLSGSIFGPMDYNASTGEVYVPDRRGNVMDVLAPVGTGATDIPHEPSSVIPLASSPQAVAITSDGQLGFVALASGAVVMLDIPGRQVVNTIAVGGSPHFIITGLYPSLFGLTTQQVSFLSIIVGYTHYIAAGVIVLAALLAIWWQKRTQRTRKVQS